MDTRLAEFIALETDIFAEGNYTARDSHTFALSAWPRSVHQELERGLEELGQVNP